MKRSAQTDLLSINAQNYRQADMEGKNHPYEVPLSNLVELHIDYKQMGLGGDNSWGRFLHDPYLLKEQLSICLFDAAPTGKGGTQNHKFLSI